MATGESTAVKHIDGFERAGDALVDGVKKVGLRLVGEAVPFGSRIPAVRRQLEEDAAARRQEWYDNLTPERRARFDAYVAEDGAVLKAAGQQRRELLTMFPDMPGGPGEELQGAAVMATIPGSMGAARYGKRYNRTAIKSTPVDVLGEVAASRSAKTAKPKFSKDVPVSTSSPVSPYFRDFYFDHTDGDFTSVPRGVTARAVKLGFPEVLDTGGQTWKRVHVSRPKIRELVEDPIEGYRMVTTGRIDKNSPPHSVYYSDGHRLLRFSNHWAMEGDVKSVAGSKWVRFDHNVGDPVVGGFSGGVIEFNKLSRNPEEYFTFGYPNDDYTPPGYTNWDFNPAYDRTSFSGEYQVGGGYKLGDVFPEVRQDAKGGEASDVHADSRGGDSIRAAEEGGEAAQDEVPQEEVPQEGGPRIIINPEVFNDKRDALCVAMNEAFRIIMEMNGFDPASEPTPAQRRFFADTAYANDEVMLRRTILARICTFDTSIGEPSKGEHTGHSESTAPTDEQIQEAIEFLHTVLEIGAPQNEWEQSAVQRIIERLESGAKVSGGAEEAPDDPDSGDPRQTQGALGGGMTDDELAEQGLSVNENFGKPVEELGKIPVKGPAEEEDKWKAWREARERGNFTTHSQDGVDENGFKIGVEIPEEWKKMNTPQAQAPQAQAPQAQAPQAQAPQAQAPQAQAQTPQLQPPQLQLPQYANPLRGLATAQTSGATGEQKAQNEQGVGNKRAQAKGIHKDGNNYVDANGRRIGFSDYSWYGLS